MSIVPVGVGAFAWLAFLPRWLIAVLATAGLPGFLRLMWVWNRHIQATWDCPECNAIYPILPLMLAVVATIGVIGLWVGAIEPKRGALRQMKECPRCRGLPASRDYLSDPAPGCPCTNLEVQDG